MCVLGALLQIEEGWVPFAIGVWTVYCTKQAHNSTQMILGKRPNEGVLLPMVLDSGELQGFHGG